MGDQTVVHSTEALSERVWIDATHGEWTWRLAFVVEPSGGPKVDDEAWLVRLLDRSPEPWGIPGTWTIPHTVRGARSQADVYVHRLAESVAGFLSAREAARPLADAASAAARAVDTLMKGIIENG